MRRLSAAAVLCLAVPLAACPGSPGGGDDDPMPDATPEGWQTLIRAEWSIPPGEQYRCQRLTVAEDVWIKNFRSIIPQGHHHAVLTLTTSPTAADGQASCNAGVNAPLMIYGSAPGTDDIALPEGVAVKVPAGSQMLLNLHLYNTLPGADLAGVSEILYQPVAPADVASTTEAEVVLMGPVGFTIDPGVQTVRGGCTMSGAATIFMTNPHMHRLGTHARVVARVGGQEQVVHDAPYDFEEQRFYAIAPAVQLAQGDRVEVTCTYDNDTGGPVSFGDSTDQEMCFATTYRYPKLGGGGLGPICTF
jgi:hypothetical protein